MNIKIPAGLPVLFMTEVWERFGFYIAQGLLALYMTKNFNFSDNVSYDILGAFTALAYIAPVIGGYIADKLLGFKNTVLLGGVFLCIGYAILAINHFPTFYFALAMIVTGTGLLKPNISSLVGTLYEPNDPSRETGFTIFYVGIYVGVLLSTVTSGYVSAGFGWRASFSLASFGIVIALITFIAGKKRLVGHGEFILSPEKNRTSMKTLAVGMVTTTLLFSWLIINFYHLADNVFLLLSFVVGIFLVSLILRYRGEQQKHVLLLTILFGFSTIFWALYFQTFFSLTLFIERDVNRVLLGATVPTIAFMSIIPLGIIFIGPWLARTWENLKLKNRDFNLATKFGLGLIATGLGFFVVFLGILFPNKHGLISSVWIVISYLLITLGELFISPIGLSMVTELAPSKLVGLFMGCWFFSLGVGGQLAGVIAKYTAVPKELLNVVNEHVLIYQHGFMIYAVLGVGSGLLLLLGNYFYKKKINHQSNK